MPTNWYSFWSRLQPSTRNPSIETGLQAQIHDPLWTLARQWQLGEFRGEDAGSPIDVQIQHTSTWPTMYKPGPPSDMGTTAFAYDSASMPIEVLVERERVHAVDSMSVRSSAEAGLYFLRLLSRDGLGTYRQHYVERYPLNPWLLRRTDMRNIDSLVLELYNSVATQDPASAEISQHSRLSSYLYNQLTTHMQSLIDVFALEIRKRKGSNTPVVFSPLLDDVEARTQFINSLLADLNSRVCTSSDLYDIANSEIRFGDVVLRDMLRRLAEKSARGTLTTEARSHVNRQLLEVAYPNAVTPLDDDTVGFFAVLSARVPDGEQLYRVLKSALQPSDGTDPALPPDSDIALIHRKDVERVCQTWLNWSDSLFSQPKRNVPSAWVPERMEYQFDLAALHEGATEIVLQAPEYKGNRVDWHTFDLTANLDTRLGAVAASEATSSVALPAPVRFRGMPSARWWQFEDASVNFDSISASPEDLGRLLLIEFSVVYGNDWFVVPVDVPVGALTQITSVQVSDTFGFTTRVKHYSDVASSKPMGFWRMFSLESAETASQPTAETEHAFSSFLFVPPVLGPTLESQPIEDVLFMRDEMANLAWAVEKVVEGPSGFAIDRFDASQQRKGRASPPADVTARPTVQGLGDDVHLMYHLMTNVPDNWIPLVPQRLRLLGRGDDGKPKDWLVRGLMVGSSSIAPYNQSEGRVLQPELELRLFPEEVPRSGARVTRYYRYARWGDGSTHLWVARKKHAGLGEGSSGLRFDTIETI